MKLEYSVPVIMFHSVVPSRIKIWRYSHISNTLHVFESYLKYLIANDYNFVFIKDVYYHKKGIKKLRRKSICFTFDDGYLDNWIYVYPLLKKYGAKATIFVSGEFIDSSTELRFNLNDYWDSKCEFKDLKKTGFLNWNEMRELEKSGVMDIESHLMTHSHYPVTNNIVDFYYPGNPYYWVTWNIEKDAKPYYIKEIESNKYNKYLGYPIYENKPSICARKISENNNIKIELNKFVLKQGGSKFFKNRNWREILYSLVSKLNIDSEIITESEDDYNERLDYEIGNSKKILEENLNKQISILCWPNGGYTLDAHRKAILKGYYATTAKGSRNIFNSEEPDKIERFSLKEINNNEVLSIFFLKYKLGSYNGKRFYSILHKIQKKIRRV